jgi:hypothetical protein
MTLFTAPRIAVIVVMLALVSGSFLFAPGLLDDSVEPLPAVTPPSPSAPATEEPTASSAAEPSPSPTLESTVSTAESSFAATRVLTVLPPGADPASLSPGPFGTTLFIDRAAETVYEVGEDGYPTVIATAGVQPAAEMVAPIIALRGGTSIVIYDADGRGWWSGGLEVGPLRGGIDHTGRETDADTIDPATTVATAITYGQDRYSIQLIEPETGDIIAYHYRDADDSFVGIDQRIERDDPGRVLGLHADERLWVLTEDGVGTYGEDWSEDEWSDAVIAPAPGDTPDYRYIGGTGAWDGELWLYDAAGRRFVAFDKSDGSYLGSWAPGPTGPDLGDVRGMYVEGDKKGRATVVTWLTPEGVMQSAVSDPKAIRPKPIPHQDGLKPSKREPGERAIEWSAGGVSMEADRVRIRADGKTFKAPGEVLTAFESGPRSGTLESYWYEHDLEQRLYINMGSDGVNWWIGDIWTYDGEKGGDWILFEDLMTLTRTPIGEAIEGNLRLKSTGGDREHRKPDTATLRIDGLRLAGFPPPPRIRPAALTDCAYVDPALVGEEGRAFDLMQGPGEPMAGIKDMTPAEAEALLEDLGYCYRFWHSYRIPNPIEDKRLRKHFYDVVTDRRCSAPEHGRIGLVSFGRDYRAGIDGIVVTVHVDDKQVRDLPEPPPYGTDCQPQEAS